MKIVLAAGGTAGHVFPAVALADELMARGHDVTCWTDARGSKYFPSQLAAQALASGGLVSGSVIKRIAGLAKLGRGYLQARRKLKALKADIVVGFGGYPSAAPLLAAQHLGTPTVLHEQNSVFGRANKLVGKKADAIALSFEHTQGAPDGAALTGNPVRSTFEALPAYSPPTGSIRLLITGGSLGGGPVAEAIPPALAELPEALRARLDVLAQMPAGLVEKLSAEYRALGVTAQCVSFIDDMPAEVAAAHLIVARSGATTVTELIAAARPALFIPLDVHADQHQIRNAQALVDAGAAQMILNSALSPARIGQILSTLLSDPQQLTNMGLAAKALAHGQRNTRSGRSATQALADLVLATLDR